MKRPDPFNVWTCPVCSGQNTQSGNFELVWHPELGAYLAEPITIRCMDCGKESNVFKVKVQFT